MDDTLDINYRFTFASGESRSFTISLDRADLSLRGTPPVKPPPWSFLHHHRCGVCSVEGSHCPVALNLVDVVATFRDRLSHEQVSVEVTTDERSYRKETTIQEGLSSLKGIIMTTSGCPVMARLKPMVRFHLPFATLEETSFRMVSLYLVSQYLRRRKGLDADTTLAGLEKIYADVADVNRCFAQRLAEVTKKDANVNALVNLDCYAEMIPLTADDMLGDLESYFTAYLS